MQRHYDVNSGFIMQKDTAGAAPVPSRLCKPLGVYFHIYIQLNSEDDRFAPSNTLNRHWHMQNVLL